MSGRDPWKYWSAVALSTYREWSRTRDKVFSVAVGRSFAAFGEASVIQLPVRIAGESQIAVGSGVFIGAGSWLQVLGEGSSSRDIRIVVGDGTRIAGHCVLSAAKAIRVGENVLMARNVYVSDHNHAYRQDTRPVLHQGIDAVLPVEIGDGAWLGQNTVVTSGVRIGCGAVIGANSVVKSDVPDHCLAVGAPARVVRRFFGVESE